MSESGRHVTARALRCPQWKGLRRSTSEQTRILVKYKNFTDFSGRGGGLFCSPLEQLR